MIIVSPDPAAVIAVAKAHGIEARAIGKIVKKPGIRLTSRGHNAKQEGVLEF
jgi:hypothetical protein